jgi:hypothetical protein
MEVMVINIGPDWAVCITGKGAKNSQILVTEEKAKRIIAELDLMQGVGETGSVFYYSQEKSKYTSCSQ